MALQREATLRADASPNQGLRTTYRRGTMDFGSSLLQWPLFVPPAGPPSSRIYVPPVIEVAPDARWQDVTIYPMNGETIGVALQGERPRHYHAVEIGMAHKVTRNPTVSFALLLHLCAQGGRTDWRAARSADDARIAFDNYAAFKMQAYALRRSLRRLFGIATDPFASLKARSGLVTSFRAQPTAPGESRYVPRAIGTSRNSGGTRSVSHTPFSEQ